MGFVIPGACCMPMQAAVQPLRADTTSLHNLHSGLSGPRHSQASPRLQAAYSACLQDPPVLPVPPLAPPNIKQPPPCPRHEHASPRHRAAHPAAQGSRRSAHWTVRGHLIAQPSILTNRPHPSPHHRAAHLAAPGSRRSAHWAAPGPRAGTWTGSGTWLRSGTA